MALVTTTGTDTIPVLVSDDGAAVIGEANILAYIGEHFDEPPEAEAQHAEAAMAHRRYLEEECAC